MDCRVISLGTLPSHPLRDKARAARTGHATTTLVRSGDAAILIDPGLPAPALAARLDERAGLRPDDITHVFLSSFQPDTARGIHAFDHAEWLIALPEREARGVPLARLLLDAQHADDETRAELQFQVAILERCRPAPDTLARGVDLFPLPGVTPGLTGLLLAQPTHTTLICGDSVATIEHLERGQVLTPCHDIERARESFAEAIEIADYLIPGRDNIVPNPSRRPF